MIKRAINSQLMAYSHVFIVSLISGRVLHRVWYCRLVHTWYKVGILKQLSLIKPLCFNKLKWQVTSLFNIHSLHDIHGIMSIIYKQVIEINIEANNAWKVIIYRLQREKQSHLNISISTYMKLYFVIINKDYTLWQLTKKHI